MPLGAMLLASLANLMKQLGTEEYCEMQGGSFKGSHKKFAIQGFLNYFGSNLADYSEQS